MMGSTKSLSAATSANPSPFPARFEIRRLTARETQWAAAIFMHSHAFCGVFAETYPHDRAARFNAGMRDGPYLIEHQVDSGLSFGAFDLEYKFKRPESAATNGKFYWDPNNDKVTAEEVLEQMDFPLASIALSYDGYDPLDPARMGPLVAVFPNFMNIFNQLVDLDKRDPASWKPSARGQVLLRNGSSTRRDYEGFGLFAKMARWLMYQAKLEGFRSIQIECVDDRVTHVWLNAPAPFRSTLISEFQTADYETTDEDGKAYNPFYPAKRRVTKIFTEL